MQIILAINASDAIRQLNQPHSVAGFRVCFLDTESTSDIQSFDSYAAIVIGFQGESQSAQEICFAVRQATPLMPLIVVSPKTDLRTKVCLLDLGADDYLEEPFATEELVARLRSIIRSRRPRHNSAGA